MASGFGSVRRFNETFQQLYGRPPQALRRSRQADEPIADKATITVNLPYRPPYDWETMLSFLALRAIPKVESVEDGVYRRTIAIGEARGRITVERGDGPFVKVTVRIADLRTLPTIIARVRRVFDLAADPDSIGAHLSADPTLGPLIAVRPGLRVPGAWDGFELSIRAILGQQITVGAARGLAAKIVDRYGEALDPVMTDPQHGLTHVFPAPERLAEEDLSTLGMPRARAIALSSLARAVVEDPKIFGPKRSLEEAIGQLKALNGIGEWSAQYIAMRELREPDAFPSADVGLMRALADETGRRPTPEEMLVRAETWRPWRAYAALHLWAAETAEVERKAHARQAAA
jgi:AraC family transcriptional regulator of adaptative response / DNA-3-methyladenine glycosylase II